MSTKDDTIKFRNGAQMGTENLPTVVKFDDDFTPDFATEQSMILINTKLQSIMGYVDGLESALALLGTQTTLAAILTKLSADPATQTTLAAVLAKLSADPATQTTLAAVLAKLATLGQKVMSGSMPVTFASDQSTLLTSRIGVARAMTHTPITAGVANTTALALNANRKYALIVNDSANVIYIKLGATAALNTGIRLNAGGGSYEINETNLYTGIIDCISSVASQNLLVTEGV